MSPGRHAKPNNAHNDKSRLWERLSNSNLLLVAAAGVSLLLVGNLLTSGPDPVQPGAQNSPAVASASPLAQTLPGQVAAQPPQEQARALPVNPAAPLPSTDTNPTGNTQPPEATSNPSGQGAQQRQEAAPARTEQQGSQEQAPSGPPTQNPNPTSTASEEGQTGQPSSPQAPAYTGPTNVLIILTDDQRAGTETAMPVVSSELIDKGTHYVNAVVPTSWCCPSRVSLLTGQYAHNTGVWDNSDSVPYGAWPAFKGNAEERTLAVALDKAGYRTGLFGKYINGMENAPTGYQPPGWDEFLALAGSGDGYTDYPLTDGRRIVGPYSTDFFAKETENFIRQTPQNQPFFAMFTPFAPHSPFTAGPYAGKGKPYLEKAKTAARWPGPTVNERDVSDRPKWVGKLPVSNYFDERRTDMTIEQAISGQQDTLMGVDSAVKDLLRALKDTGRLENTLIIYASDNGYAWGEHRTRGKNTPYDASIRVPLVMRWDAKQLGSNVDNRLVAANIDVTGTILQATGQRMRNLDGKSLLSDYVRDGVLLEATRWRGEKERPAYCGWRTTDAMWVRYSTGEEELYDYRIDPYEQINRAKDPNYQAMRQDYYQKARQGCLPLPPRFSWGGLSARSS